MTAHSKIAFVDLFMNSVSWTGNNILGSQIEQIPHGCWRTAHLNVSAVTFYWSTHQCEVAAVTHEEQTHTQRLLHLFMSHIIVNVDIIDFLKVYIFMPKLMSQRLNLCENHFCAQHFTLFRSLQVKTLLQQVLYSINESRRGFLMSGMETDWCPSGPLSSTFINCT